MLSPQITPSAPLRMSYEEYLQWAGEDIHAEWVDGEVIVHMPPTDLHQATLGFLHILLGLFVQFFKRGRLLLAPFEMRLLPGRSSREPDILFVSNEHLERLTEERLVGPADLVVEIISDDSVQRDRRDKFKEYRTAGIREYWIIDPRASKRRADFFRLTEDGDYELFATEDDERVASLVLPGFWLRPAWLWQASDLEPFAAFCEMAGLPAEVMAQMRQQIEVGFKQS
ncbi:MAG: Uma2 family endonuclease [Chloroflexi bacterium]|nr:Uma2 family endonuclease [Chloroflexota bacterium]